MYGRGDGCEAFAGAESIVASKRGDILKKAYFIDTEVASLETRDLIQLAYAGLDGPAKVHWFRPASGVWDPSAVAVHGIIPEDIPQSCPLSTEFASAIPTDMDYVIGHNVDFDAEVLGGLPYAKRICTLALARAAYPRLSSHKLGAVFLHALGMTYENRKMLREAHDAVVDVDIVRLILPHLTMVQIGISPTWAEELWSLSEQARIPTLMPFGKHKGEEITRIPADYRKWLLKQDNVDPYLRKAFEL